MPVIERDGVWIDYVDEGRGEPVVLVHSSVIGNRQWRRLIEDLRGRFRVLAPNLYGYGDTTPWTQDGTQTLADQTRLITALCGELRHPIRIVGHSWGGHIALKAAAELGARVSHLYLFEPNPWYLLKQNGRHEAFAEAMAMYRDVKALGKRGEWLTLAERFTEYFSGDGAWAAMPCDRRRALAQRLRPNYYEWDALDTDSTPAEEFGRMPAATMLAISAGARLALREIADVLRTACPHWEFATLAEGGHMAPLTRPDLVNPAIRAFFG